MEEAELLVNQALERLGMGCTEIEIPDLSGKIEAVEAEIREICETDPYQYKFLLDNPGLVREKKEDLEAQLKSFSDYERELDMIIDELLKSGTEFIRIMN